MMHVKGVDGWMDGSMVCCCDGDCEEARILVSKDEREKRKREKTKREKTKREKKN